MNNEKNVFSIKDLENLSGIKAHTIRIWEKRYNILGPMRTNTNIRYYDSQNLKKLLNITLLHNHGYKISKIATYPEDEIPSLIKEIISKKSTKHHAINAFKIATVEFDEPRFQKIYETLLSEKSFREIFLEVFVPLMNEIGMLWQEGTILATHEHFITQLIRQKLIVNIEKIQSDLLIYQDRTFVLCLPENEIHDTALLYLNYEILSNGYKSVYLGANVSTENLTGLKQHLPNITFVSYISLYSEEEMNTYISNFQHKILDDENSELWLMGKSIQYISPHLPENITAFQSIADFVKKL